MTKLTINKNGFGKCVTKDGTTYSVLRVDGLYNLNVGRKGQFDFWVKENAKRLSTIQRFADNHNYGIQIVEE